MEIILEDIRGQNRAVMEAMEDGFRSVRDDLGGRIDRLEQRTGALETVVASHSREFKQVHATLARIEGDLQRVEREHGGRLERIEREHGGRLERIEREHGTRLERIEQKVDDAVRRDEFDAIEHRVTALESPR